MNELNEQGIKTIHGCKFTLNSLRHILKNRTYTGLYKYSDIVIEDGMPRLISDELFEAAQKQFEKNKHKAKTPSVEEDAPRYWLTGKLYCGECGNTMHGVSGTSKTGKIHYYYSCKNYRKHKCNLPYIPKDTLESHVVWILRQLLTDTENLASLAVDIAAYYKELNADINYIKGLEAELKESEKSINNLIKALENGVVSETITNRLAELENRKAALKEAIDTEKLKQAIVDDDYSIQTYFDKYAHADFDDIETRDTILEYFVDKIYVYVDRLVITWYYTNDKTEIDLDTLTDITNTDVNKKKRSSTLKLSAPLKKRRVYGVFSITALLQIQVGCHNSE